MAAPAYAWEYVTNLFGLNPPVVASFEATSALYAKVGTLLVMASGQVDEATASVVLPVGLCAVDMTAAATAADPIPVYVLRPGDVIRGTADADASSYSGFNGKTMDFNADGSLNVADPSAGCAAIWRTENAGLTVFITLSKLATF